MTPADAATLKGYFDAVEAVRSQAESQWGCGRLERLAGPDLLARFRRQQQTWREALEAAWTAEVITAEALALVTQKTAAMIRAWAALEAAASEAGHRPIAPWVWEVRLKDGTVAAFVQTDAEASKVIADGRYLRVYTLAEVSTILSDWPESLRPVPCMRWYGDPLPEAAFPRTTDDAIPWDDPIPFGAVA